MYFFLFLFSFFFFQGFIWLFGLCLSLASAFLFPVTTVSFYCDEGALSADGMDLLFGRMYHVLFPFGVCCLLVTVTSYSLIVWRIRRQNAKSAVFGQQSPTGRRRRRAFSHSGIFLQSLPLAEFQRITAAAGAAAPAPFPVAHDRRRTSLPMKELRRVKRGRRSDQGRQEEEGEEVVLGKEQPRMERNNTCSSSASSLRSNRPTLKKQPALCVDDNDDGNDGNGDNDNSNGNSDKGDGNGNGDVSVRRRSPPLCSSASPKFLAPPPPPPLSSRPQSFRLSGQSEDSSSAGATTLDPPLGERSQAGAKQLWVKIKKVI